MNSKTVIYVKLNSLFTVVAYLSGSQLSFEKLAKDSGIKKETLRKYLEYLEAAFLIKMVKRTDSNAKNYQRETQFKIYLTNPSLRCALFMPITEHHQEIGNMVETALFAQMFPRNSSNLRYANWKQGRSEGEVDMVGLSPAKQKPNWAVEIKWTNKFFFRPDELKSLSVFMDINKLSDSIVTTMTESGIKEIKGNHHLYFIPAACYAYAVSKNTIFRSINFRNTKSSRKTLKFLPLSFKAISISEIACRISSKNLFMVSSINQLFRCIQLFSEITVCYIGIYH